jgi:two-component system cell cycle sensor histidine kinase/response regulator CckA
LPVNRPLRLLVVEDVEEDELLLVAALRLGGFDVTHKRVQTADGLRAALLEQTWDIVVSDYSMPGFSGLGALAVLKATGIDVPLIIASGTIGEDSAVEALKAGAADFVLKGRLARLVPAIDREMRQAILRRQRLALEEQIRQSQKMEAIGGLAAGIAHDFNNLLMIMSGYCELLAERLLGNPEGTAELEEIQRAATSATALTRQLLAFSRRQILAPQTLNLNAILTNSQKMMRRLVEENVQIDLRLGDPLLPIHIDAGQVEQVLLNLLVNARDAMPNGGVVTVATSNLTIDESNAGEHVDLQPGLHVLLSVGDTGHGIPPEVKARLFEPFFTTKERGRGTGLGLATVYGIVKQSGGDILIDSEVGVGTTFNIYLPAAVGAVVPGAEDSRQVPATLAGHETILIVEDADSLRALAERGLRRYGYRVLLAKGGEEAQQMLTDHTEPIHVVLTDVVMPGGGGRVLGDWIEQHRPQTKVIFMSGYTDTAMVHHGVLDPGKVFVQKPFSPESLASKIREVLG